jgi:hypothetical protein
MPIAIMPSVIMLSAFIPRVVAPLFQPLKVLPENEKKKYF